MEGTANYVPVIGYLSASVEWARRGPDPDAWRQCWTDPAAQSYYFMGKDNIVFHSVIWPALLLGYSGEGSRDGEPGRLGRLNLPTEVVSSEDGSIAALLGASPGASTSVSIMLHLMQRCFMDEIGTTAWQTKLKGMIPSFGESLARDANLSEQIISRTNRILELSDE